MISQVRAEKLRSKFTHGTKLMHLSLGVALGKYFLIASSASLFSPFCILFTFPELCISLEFCWNNQRIGASWARSCFHNSNLLSEYLLSERFLLYTLQPSLTPTPFLNHDWLRYLPCGLSWLWFLTGWCFQAGHGKLWVVFLSSCREKHLSVLCSLGGFCSGFVSFLTLQH